MKIKDIEEKWEVSYAASKVTSLIEELKSITNQDYFDIESLEKARERMRDDICNYLEEVRQATAESYIKAGKIIKLNTSDGISLTKSTYIKFSKIDPNNDEIICDLVEVIKGDYINKIEFKKQEKKYISSILTEITSTIDGAEEGPNIDAEYNNYINSLTTAL